MKILLAHVDKSPQETRRLARIAAATPAGVTVTCHSIVLDGAGGHLDWDELDNAWRHRHPVLLAHYERLRAACTGHDALLLFNGANLHPSFLRHLPTFNVYCCFDDPESSAKLSRHVAARFDAAFHGNIAARMLYESFGCTKLAHLPLFTMPDVDPAEREELLGAERTNDVVFCCGRTRWRRDRLDRLIAAFPGARHHGRGSRDGWIADDDLLALYRATKIGWNVHNSTGPINARMFELAAFGIMQIGDNRAGLARLFAPGVEAVGFDTVPEAIDATRHYLAHDDERRAIAAAGFDRYWRDYETRALWRRVADQIAEWRGDTPPRDPAPLPPPPGAIRRRWRLARCAAGDAALRSARALRRARRRRDRRLRPFATELDERFYLGEPVPIGGAEHLPLGPRPAPSTIDPALLPLRRRALAWAATSFVGTARRIRFVGEPDDGFVGLAPSTPECTIVVDGGASDLVVAILDPRDPSWTGFVGTLPATERVLVAFPAIDDHADPVTSRLVSALAAPGTTTHLFHLPDPLSPWIEPLPRTLAGVSVLAERQPTAG